MLLLNHFGCWLEGCCLVGIIMSFTGKGYGICGWNNMAACRLVLVSRRTDPLLSYPILASVDPILASIFLL